MSNTLQVVQKSGTQSLDTIVVNQAKLGWALVGSPFNINGIPTQLMIKVVTSAVNPGYKTVTKVGQNGLEAQVTALLALGWMLYGQAYEYGGQICQAMVLGDIEIASISTSDALGTISYEIDATPTEAAVLNIPDSQALIINILLWPSAPLNNLTINLPPIKAGRRVFIYTDKSISDLEVSTEENGVIVRNGMIMLNDYDQAVFNSVSSDIWARVVTS